MTRPTYSRINPDVSGGFRKPEADPPRATRRTRAVEILLFSTFGLIVVLAALSIWALYSPRWKEVPNRVDAGIEADRVNVLLIGIGGSSHIGGGKDLADALILASFKPSTREVAMVSVPRDLYLEIGSYGTHRINEAHRIGNQTAYPGRGPKLTMDTVEGIFGVPIHAFITVDFEAFEKIVDQVGGIDVLVETSFHDYLFDDGFEKGWQHLNGERALRYARYRYVRASAEGNTFARERRQQQVIDALRVKLRESRGAALHLIRAARTMSAHSATNLTNAQMVWFWRTFGEVEGEQVHRVSLEPYMEVFELRSLAGQGEAVRPLSGDFQDLQRVAKGIFSEQRTAAGTVHETAKSGPPLQAGARSAAAAAPSGRPGGSGS